MKNKLIKKLKTIERFNAIYRLIPLCSFPIFFFIITLNRFILNINYQLLLGVWCLILLLSMAAGAYLGNLHRQLKSSNSYLVYTNIENNLQIIRTVNFELMCEYSSSFIDPNRNLSYSDIQKTAIKRMLALIEEPKNKRLFKTISINDNKLILS